MADGFSIVSFLGSIKTAKEIITLILDAPKVLEKAEFQYKIATLKKSFSELENQALEFEKKIEEKDSEIEKLKKLLNQKKSPLTDELPEECIKILEFLVEEPSTLDEISEYFQVSEEKAKYLLELLSERKLVDFSTNYDPSPWDVGRVPHYALNPDSRKFLVGKKLL